jgi:outer membrane protein OmpA-like peptidoglycan-associated protein
MPAVQAGAVGSTLLNESFATGSVTTDWVMPAGSAGVCLTAGTNTSATPIPDCGSGQSSGALQLTNNSGGQVGTVYSDVAVPTADGLDISWTSYQFNGSGADGISFDLAAVNPSDPTAPSTVGPSGGSLGYSTDQSTDGVPYGYLGFGADVYGNFENSAFGGSACGQSDSAASESLGVRGPGNALSGYCLLSQKKLSSPLSLDDGSATSRAATLGVPEEVVVNTTGSAITAGTSGISVPAGDWMFAVKPLSSNKTGSTWESLDGALPKSPVGVPSSWLNSTDLPKDMAFGFAASTGGSNEYHQINELNVDSLTAAPTLALTNTTSNAGTITAGGSGTVTLTPSVASTSTVSEADPVVVADTFPSSLTPTAASGTDWVCTVTSPTVSCTYTPSSPIAAGTALPPVNVTVTASATPGSFSNTAQATSQDAAPATATATGTVKSPQTVTFGTSAPTDALVGNTYDVGASSSSHLTVPITVDPSSSTVCSISSNVVTMLSTGTCLLNANQAGNSTYLPATQVQQSFAVDATQTVSFAPDTSLTAVVGGPAYTPTATATSGLAVAVTVDSSSTAVCTISGGAVSFIGGGICTLDANQSGNSTYTAASEVQQSFAVAKATQTVSFSSTAPAEAVVGPTTYAVSATASSTLTPTITVAGSSSSVCTISGGTVSFIGGGVCTLDANQAGDNAYDAAPQVLQSFEVANTQTVSFSSSVPEPAVAALNDTYTPTATASSGLTPTLTVDASSSTVCIMSGPVISFIGSGTCTIDANQAGGVNAGLTYAPAPQVQQSFYVQPQGVIAFTTSGPPNAEVDGASYTAAASASDSESVLITSDTPSVCSINGSDVVTFNDGGLCTLVATDTSDTAATQSFTVANLQTVSFGTGAPSTAIVGGTSYLPTATATSLLGVTITSGSTSVCAISGGVVTYLKGGVCTLDANQTGGVNGGLTYAPAPQVQQSFAVNLIPQTVSYTSPAPSTAQINGTYTPAATASSGLGVTTTIDSLSSGVCSISGGVVTFIGSGTCTVDTAQAGNSEYASAAVAQQSFAVAQLSQTISFVSAAPEPALVNGTYTPNATATSTLPVVIGVDPSASAVCSIASGLVTFHATGLCVLNANQAGNDQYPAAVQVSQAFNVASTQTVQFTTTAPSDAVYGALYVAAATATSALSPTITVDPSSTPGACSVNDNTVLFTGAGTCVLDANQAGDASYDAAPQMQQSITIAPAALTITANSSTITAGGTVTASMTPSGLIGEDAVSGVTYTYTGASGTTYGPSTTAPESAGTYSITPSNLTLSSGAMSNYDVTYATGTLTINSLPPQTIALTFGALPSDVTYGGTPSAYSVVATASPNIGVIVYTSTTPGVCSVSADGQLTILGVGTCTIDANDAATGGYAAASQISESFGVTAGTSGTGSSGTGPSGTGPGKGSPGKGSPGKGSTKPKRLSLTVDFANDSWALSGGARAHIRALASAIKSDHLSRVSVTGYASSTGTTPGNNVLGTQRASAVASYLKNSLANLMVGGVHFSTAADGASKFVASPPSAPANRRAQIEAS